MAHRLNSQSLKSHTLKSHRSWLYFTLVIVFFFGFMKPQSTFAEGEEVETWHPVAAAYQRALFYANLGPQIDWELIASEYNTPIADDGYGNQTVMQLLEQVDLATEMPYAGAIKQAIADHDRQALYAASTRAVSKIIFRHTIAAAEVKLAEPGAALPEVLEARRLYRAFYDNFILEADPDMVLTLDEAWQEMMRTVGSAGAATSASSDAVGFAAARTAIESYLETNYEVENFTEREKLAPIPERVADVEIGAWLPPGSNIDDQNPLPLLRLNFEARGFTESDIPLVAYGDMLFDSPQLYGDTAKSLGVACSTCHNRSDVNNAFFIPGVSHRAGGADVDGAFFNPFFNDQRSDHVDTPSLRGICFTAPYGRDGRFGSLRDFTRNVIVNEFGGGEPTPFVLDALLAYMLEFDWQPNSLLNRDGSLTDDASLEAHRGELLFNKPFGAMGGKSCASCHIPGNAFVDGKHHDIGSDDPSGPFALDDFFDTPTLLNSAYSAPYFHDGSLATLGDVVAWFDTTYGLGLTERDRSELTEYLVAVGSADTPYEEFDEENTEFMLAWSELTTFCSTLGSKLIPQRDAAHALLLLDTVIPEFRTEATAVKDSSQTELVFSVADKLEEMKVAIQDDDWEKAATLYDEYEYMAYEYGPTLK